MITLDGVSKRYGADSVAVAALSLIVPDGELCVFVGPSGCGKTTTLRMINRLIEPSGGRILIDGVDVLQMDPVTLRRGIGYVIQQGGLFPHRRVADNIATVPRLLGWDKDRVDARVQELLALVGLDAGQYARRFPHELSGGERQRVGVARALGGDPPVLLMDEPFGAVDPVTRQRLQQQFIELQRELKKTIVFVTHDIEEAAKLGTASPSCPRAACSSSTTRRHRFSALRPPPLWPTSSARTGGFDDWPSRPSSSMTWCSLPRLLRDCPWSTPARVPRGRITDGRSWWTTVSTSSVGRPRGGADGIRDGSPGAF